MATQLFLKDTYVAALDAWNSGLAYPTLRGANGSLDIPASPPMTNYALGTTRGAVLKVASGVTVTGPTPGVEQGSGTLVSAWQTQALAADATIAGAITFNFWADESSMNANAAVNCRVMCLRADGTFVQIHKTVRAVENATASAVNNWSETPTSFVAKRGDRLLIVPFHADGGGTMASGFTAAVYFGGPTAAANGDSYVTFTENLTFQTTAPTGSTVYLTNSAASGGINPGSATELEAWTSRGAGVQSPTVAAVAGPTAGVQAASGGTPIEWYTRPLQAFTLAGPIATNVRVAQTGTTAHAMIRVEVAVTDGDGSNPVVWGTNGYGVSGGNPDIGTSELVSAVWVTGASTAIADGKRLRFRLLFDDIYRGGTFIQMAATGNLQVFYAGTTSNASGDTWVRFAETLAEFVAGPATITVPLLDAAPALSAPVLAFTPQALTVPALDAVAALYAPTIVAGPASLTAPLLDGAPTLYAPTLSPQPVTVTVGLVDAGSAVYTPTLVAKNTLALGLVDGAAALYSPAILANQALVLGLLDAAPTVYAPTVVPAAVTLTAPLLSSTSAVYAPTLTVGAVGLTVPLLDAGAAVYAPTVAPAGGAVQAVTLNFLDGAPTTYAPSLSATISLGLIDASSTTYAPALVAKSLLIVPFLDAGPVLSAPTLIATALTIAPPLLDSSPALYPPATVQLQSLAVPVLDSGRALYAPAIFQVQSLTVPLLDAGPAVYAPTIVAKSTLGLGLLDAAPTLSAPAITAAPITLTVGLIDGAAAVYAPTLVPTALTIAPAVLDAGPALYAPTVKGATVNLTIPALVSTSAVYAPTVVNLAPYLVVPQFDAGRAIYAPSLTAGAVSISAGFLDGSPTVYAPTLGKLNTIPLGFLDAAAGVYAPAILGGVLNLGGFSPSASAFGPIPVSSGSSSNANGSASTPVLVGTASHPKPGS